MLIYRVARFARTFIRGQNGSKGVVEYIDATSIQNAQIM